MNDPKALTTKDIAERLQIAEQTARAWLQSGRIPGGFAVGNHWRLLESDLQAWIDKQKELQA